ncbi:MAG: M20/M25/M40 family metallo-hydrolase [Pseudonocardiaceae bacterium]
MLALARRLIAAPPRRKPVLLVFQQAEEGYPSGAPRVLRGIPHGLRPREFIGFHLWPELPAGVIGVRPGPMLASVAGVTIQVFGLSGRVHGTAFGVDSIDALAVGTRLYTAACGQAASVVGRKRLHFG